jgi:hypothetical protein
MENIDIFKSLIDLGTIAILLYFLFIVWNDRRKTIDGKDQDLKDLNERVVNIVIDNTKTQSELREAIRQNTKVTETLTNRIYEIIKK